MSRQTKVLHAPTSGTTVKGEREKVLRRESIFLTLPHMGRIWAFVLLVSAGMSGWAQEEGEVTGDPARGKQIFETICAHCHYTTSERSPVGAPGLKGVTKRRSLAWINQWLQGPEAFAATDETAKKVIAANPTGLIMPAYPEMKNAQNRADIIAYLKTLQ